MKMNIHKYVIVGTACALLGGTGIAAASNRHHGIAPPRSVGHAVHKTKAHQASVTRGPRGLRGLTGHTGATGADGMDGADGIDGNDGADGIDGQDGAAGIDGMDGAQGLQGAPGAAGKRGQIGMSAYDVYASTTTDSPVLSQHDWLQSLKGTAGKDGKDGADGATGADGKRGATGMSAYDVYASTTTDSPVLSQHDWLQSLKGAPGPTGADGKRGPTGMSAYDVYASTTTDSPVLSQHDWLQSLKGDAGPAGSDGKRGLTGATGPQGPAGDITSATPTTICVVTSRQDSCARNGCSLHRHSQHRRLRPDFDLVVSVTKSNGTGQPRDRRDAGPASRRRVSRAPVRPDFLDRLHPVAGEGGRWCVSWAWAKSSEHLLNRPADSDG